MLKAKAIFSEALLVGVLGLVFALAANALSPRGLRLNRNYFPGAGSPPAGAPPDISSAVMSATPDAIIQRLRRRGLQAVSGEEAAELFHTAGYEQGLVLFIDARDYQHYAEGHIPGAWQFDHYRAGDYLPTILPDCLTALQVVVYCSGGECEDSEFAAMTLHAAGVARENLLIYTGGISGWATRGLPVETGPQHRIETLQPATQ